MFLLNMLNRKFKLPDEGEALKGRPQALETAENHAVSDRPLKGPYPDGHDVIYLGLGCFWGAERLFWQMDGVWVTAVGYAGGVTENPTYHETCTGQTGHTEIVLVVYDPSVVSTEQILAAFWEGHDPTQGMRQGNDVGTQYRSAIYTTTQDQADVASQSLKTYQSALDAAGRGAITTEVKAAGPFYFAEEYHQQYLHKNPGGYCGLGGTGVSCPIGLGHGPINQVRNGV